jgi:hypothetical protein
MAAKNVELENRGVFGCYLRVGGEKPQGFATP